MKFYHHRIINLKSQQPCSIPMAHGNLKVAGVTEKSKNIPRSRVFV